MILNNHSGKEIVWEAQERQALTLSCPANEIFYGGSKGGGKSDVAVVFPLKQIAKAEARFRETGLKTNGRSIIFRKDYKRLDELISRSHELIPKIEPRAKWHGEDKRWNWPSGYRYDFRHLESPYAHEAFHGQPITCPIFDQVEEIPQHQYAYIKANMRTSDTLLKPMLQSLATGNPGGRYATWVKEYFIDPFPAGNKAVEQVVQTEDGEVRWTRVYIPARLFDNKYLGKEYEANLRTLSPELQEMYINGRWDVVLGSIFGHEWNSKFHIRKPFKIPRSWFRFRSGDYGFAAPSSIGWWAVDPDNNLILYHHLRVTKHTGEMLAWRIREIEDEDGDWNTNGSKLSGPLDSACWAKTGHTGPTIAEEMIRLGCFWYKSDKNRLGAVNQMHKRLTRRSGEKGKEVAGISFFETCPSPINTIPVLPADPSDREVPDTNADDHDWDMTGYALMSRPLVPEKKFGSDEDDDILDELQARRAKRNIGYGGYG